MYMELCGMRIEVCPNNEISAKLVAGYTDCGYSVIPLYQVFPNPVKGIPTPKQTIEHIACYISDHKKNLVFTGINSYLAFLSDNERRDFFLGLRNLLDSRNDNARFLVSESYFCRDVFINPRYEEGMQIASFEGNAANETTLEITLARKEWIGNRATADLTTAALKTLGDYIPSGEYVFSADIEDLPNVDYGCMTVLKEPNSALQTLYGLEMNLPDECVDILLQECAVTLQNPMDLLVEKFGGASNLEVEKAPLRLQELQDDPLWVCYVWMLKSKVKRGSYISCVLNHVQNSHDFMRSYVTDTAKALMGNENATLYANERASVLTGKSDYEPLIAGFVSETETDDRAICFLNCGTDTELKGLIRHAKRLEHTYGLPEIYDRVSAVLNQYLSPYFDYGNVELTDYFHKLRCYRMSDSIEESFVQRALYEKIPKEIKKRDEIISNYDDENTALLVVDGMGAEYFPLLLNMADKNGMKVESKQLVCVRLPSSSDFNKIKWSAGHILPGIHRVDNISHEGYSAYEKCAFEENLAEIFITFRKVILPRIITALGTYKRVLVTADHGSSYLAVNAHRKHLDKTLPWDYGMVADWRYGVLEREIATPENMVSVYSPEDEKWYYVVKGYNRLPKSGSKPYALHGGATLEEMLVPFVVFTKDTTNDNTVVVDNEFIEDEAFDIL